MSIDSELKEQQQRALSEVAERLQVSESELAIAAVRDLVAQHSVVFEAAAQVVLDKNFELYQRLF